MEAKEMATDDIAIIGFSFKLPQGTEDETSLWDALQQRRNLMTEWPKSRLNIDSFYDPKSGRLNKLHSRGGHFLKEDPMLFDAPFFSITTKEAAAMDPQQRMTLETSYHALENAGIPVENLKGSNTAVFASSMGDDYAKMLARDPSSYPRTTITGNQISILPNRISWYFDLLGPSIHVDTACFDHRANGYGRGEGIVAIVLKRVSDAIRDGNMIRAIIKSTGTNQDGHTLSLPTPNPDSQEILIRHVYEKANLDLNETRYIEAHGTGTLVGDPAEMKSIDSVFKTCRSPNESLYVGSIKANIGHLEATSGLAGIVKSVMILEKGMIPPNALLEKIHPGIDIDHNHIKVPTEQLFWPNEGLRQVSVCSYGFGGTNAHAVLQDASHYLQRRGLTGNHHTTIVPPPITRALSNNVLTQSPDRYSFSLPLRLLIWTAADKKSLLSMVDNYQQFYSVKVAGDKEKLDRLSFTLAAHRSRMVWRAFALANVNERQETLEISPLVRASGEIGLALVFTGQGAQYVGMGVELLQYPVYRKTLWQIDQTYMSLGCKWSLFDEIQNGERIHRPEYSQPLCTALQIALTELLKSFNIIPSAVVGHSSGEIAAAYTIGALTMESACKVAYYRGQLSGKLMRESSLPSAMMSVNLSEDAIPDYLGKVNPSYLSESVHVACVNSPLNCTLSGAEDSIDDIQRHLNQDNIFAQKLKTGVAYHSPLLGTVASEYYSLMGTLNEAGPDDMATPILMISSVTGQAVSPKTLSMAQYWVDNLTSPVRFSEAIQELLSQSSGFILGGKPIVDFVEVGPHSALRRPIQDTLSFLDGRKGLVRYSSALYKLKSSLESIARLSGDLFSRGYPVSIIGVNQQASDGYKGGFLIDCPKYPFNHSRRYWWESRFSRDFRLGESPPSDILGSRSMDWNPLQPEWRNFLSLETMPWLRDHVVADTIVFPAAGMLTMAIKAVEQICPDHRKISGYYIKEASFLSPITIEATADDITETVLQLRPTQTPFEKEPVWSEVTIFTHSNNEWNERCRISLKVQYEEPTSQVDGGIEDELASRRAVHDHDLAIKSCTKYIERNSLYTHFKRNGIIYGEWFRLLDQICWNGSETASALLDVASPKFETSGVVHPAVLDAGMQVLFVQVSASPSKSTSTFVPHKIHDAWFSPMGWKYPETSIISSTATVSPRTSDRRLEGSITLVSDNGSLLCSVKRISLVAVSKKEDKNVVGNNLLYGIEWKPQLSLMKLDQLQVEPDSGARPDISHFEDLESTLCRVVSHTVRWLHGTHIRRCDILNSLNKYVQWMEEHVESSHFNERDESDEELERQIQSIEEQRPSWAIFSVVARNLKSILMGQTDPLRLAFDTGLAETLYKDFFSTVCDSRLRQFLELVCHENPNIRIFEIGAGTGTMTQYILSFLQDLEKTRGNQFAEYVYTDISASFLEKAQSRFQDERVTFRTFNVELDIGKQGIDSGTYDLVIAGSVLHATAELHVTLENVNGLLKPGGHLICVEPIAPQKLSTNFAFGTLPGWWPKDPWRSKCPVITEEQWDQVLKAHGFSGADLIIKDYEPEICRSVSLLISRARMAPHHDIPNHGVILVVDGSSSRQDKLAELISRRLLESFRIKAKTLFWNQVETVNFADSEVIISLIEIEKLCLATISCVAFETLKGMIQRSRNLMWITSTSIDDENYPSYNLAQGFLRTLRSEATEKRIVSLAFEDANMSSCDYAENILSIFEASFVFMSPEIEYIIRDGETMTGRFFEQRPLNDSVRSIAWAHSENGCWLPSPALKLAQRTPGMLDTLDFVEDAAAELELGPGEVEIESKAWGLFFRDVYVALDRLEGDDFGTDCAGVVTRVGADCYAVSPGDRVCMTSLGCMRTYPRTLATNVVKIPDTLSFETASSILSPGITAYYCLFDIAKLHQGEKILIHSATGSTGQMAIWISKLLGAEIFATVGLDEKKQLLIEEFDIPSDHIFYSRDTSFSKGVLRMTGGEGVDVVLNSLAGDGLKASWDCIAPGGRFIEIGKADIAANSMLPMANFAKNVSFIAVDLYLLAQSDPKIIGRLTFDIMDLAMKGAVQYPKPVHVFPVSEIEQSFRYLQSGLNTGRTVITPGHSDIVSKRLRYRSTWSFDPTASYLVAGGLGGLGRLIIRWMASKGAKHLILPSRSGSSSQNAVEVVSELSERGVNVVTPRCDVGVAASVTAMLRDCASSGMPPIKGCINAAMNLQDAIFENMTHEQWESTVNSKAQSSWNLHQFLPQGLDFFILLSSLSGVYGSPVQSNYAAGCTFQDALARYRTVHGEKAISLDIGWMLHSGIIAETERYQKVRRQTGDMGQIQDAELLALLELYCDPALAPLTPSESQLLIGCITPADLLAQGRPPVERMQRPLFSTFSQVKAQAARSAGGQILVDNTTLYKQATALGERWEVVTHAIAGKLAKALSIDTEDIKMDKSLSDYGVDSLMAVELRNWINNDFQANLPVFDIMGGKRIAAIGDLIVEKSAIGKDSSLAQEIDDVGEA
ncbi:hypothetical protein F4805DRAFT_459397 [Annulohypoxylon moriforme]|nr:hypothetical protein F4805DRAFT_459397 [Annulohypoxylon moriforme]